MAGNCTPGAFKILEEGEVAVGSETKSSGHETNRASTEHKAGSLFGLPIMTGEAAGKNTETSQTTTQIKEWQISYKCVAAAGNAKRGTKVQ